MAARLRDVAERTGVSVKTVSNVVNGHRHVSDPTRQRVQAAIDEMGYRPNLSARGLRSGRSGVIALALPELDNPYFAELAGFVVQAADAHGLTVLVDQTDGLVERETLVMTGIRGPLIDGLILSPIATDAEQLAGSVGRVPIVLLGEKVSHGPVDHVAIDNVAAARLATEHLLDVGCTHVVAIGDLPHSPQGSGAAQLRRHGYEEALRRRGMAVDERFVMAVPSWRRQDGASAMAALLDAARRSDGVFCFNDTLALGVLRALAERGLRVPEDVAVIGIDDVEDGRFAVPSLSTVAPDKEQIARTAVQMLVDRMHVDQDAGPRDVTAGFRLVRRESTDRFWRLRARRAGTKVGLR
ncbi:MAG: LacI family DNA-binding transcriptional regulator [Nocardioidaceae bacterium]|nr:LacI family DNA-binding transcriptional regulator [Nocardioidaceae bacterium]